VRTRLRELAAKRDAGLLKKIDAVAGPALRQ
jgi:hypothetical protein